MIGLGSMIASAILLTGGSVPVVVSVSRTLVDTAGGGAALVVQVNSSSGCTGIKVGGVACTSFAIVDATHVSGVVGAHSAGVVDVVVTNATGDSTTGTGLVEYFPDANNLKLFYDAAKSITVVSGKVSAWNDIGPVGDANRNLQQTTAANRPLYNATDAAYNNQPTVEGVAANSTSLEPVGTWLAQIPQPYTLYLVGQVGGSGYLVANSEPSFSDGHRISMFDYGLGQIGLDNYPNTNYLLPGGTPSAPGVYCYLVDGAGTSSAFANSLSSAGVSATFTDSFGFKDVMLFAMPSGQNADGKIARFIVFSGLHGLSTRTAITNALGAKYGVTISP